MHASKKLALAALVFAALGFALPYQYFRSGTDSEIDHWGYDRPEALLSALATIGAAVLLGGGGRAEAAGKPRRIAAFVAGGLGALVAVGQILHLGGSDAWSAGPGLLLHAAGAALALLGAFRARPATSP
ncbi:MAG: hypothetical protein ACT4PV_03800 [Planctomycetaceae bacterium]